MSILSCALLTGSKSHEHPAQHSVSTTAVGIAAIVLDNFVAGAVGTAGLLSTNSQQELLSLSVPPAATNPGHINARSFSFGGSKAVLPNSLYCMDQAMKAQVHY